MRTFGGLLMSLGIVLVLAAFGMKTSVYSYGGDVNNLGLLQQQMMILQTGLGAFIAGSVLITSSRTVAENSTGTASSPRDEETEDEREERLAAVRRLNRNIGIALGGLLVFLVLAALIANKIG